MSGVKTYTITMCACCRFSPQSMRFQIESNISYLSRRCNKIPHHQLYCTALYCTVLATAVQCRRRYGHRRALAQHTRHNNTQSGLSDVHVPKFTAIVCLLPPQHCQRRWSIAVGGPRRIRPTPHNCPHCFYYPERTYAAPRRFFFY